jgi:hypothetical protein
MTKTNHVPSFGVLVFAYSDFEFVSDFGFVLQVPEGIAMVSWRFAFSDFEFVSDFDIRISDLPRKHLLEV